MIANPVKLLFDKLKHQIQLGIFSRVFLTLFALLLSSLSVWLFIFLLAQQAPRATQIADRAITSYYITQRAFRFAPPEKHADLIMELVTIGDTQVFPRESTDTFVPIPNTKFWKLVSNRIRKNLIHDPNLVIAKSVNGEGGLWISLDTPDDEQYWLLIRYQALDIKQEWIYWSAIILLLSLIGSSIVALLVNKPLKQISQTVRSIGRGEAPKPLPEDKGPHELRNLFKDINHMVNDLKEAENDRQVMLAGISHDLRTPLARIRLEIEMCHIPEESQKVIDEDLEQVNHCINQLLEYYRPVTSTSPQIINISKTLRRVCELEQSYTASLNGTFTYSIEEGLYADFTGGNIKRVVSNLIENARRYGKTKDGEIRVELRVYRHHLKIHIDVMDYGVGVAPEEIARILRPFSRGEQARTDTNGSGLGLAICERLLKQFGGSLSLLPNKPCGLLCRIEIPLRNNRNIQLDEIN
ncbi:ATP-binding protein [Pelistega europaea]|uniref:ATP-binding protein n=1 Tax=Pelistega europaea TaxID=106147 RepID=UPI0014910D9E|nr:ATP-binding protein [Pelistega europaea]